MGTDIHAYIEIDRGRESEPFAGNGVVALSAAQIFIARDYLLFAALAGVRRGRSKSDGREEWPLYKARGLPETATWDVIDEYEEVITGADGATTRSPCPDWHHASWLYRDEIFQALDYDRLPIDSLDLAFRIVLDIMASIDQHLGPRRSRLVFWFDN